MNIYVVLIVYYRDNFEIEVYSTLKEAKAREKKLNEGRADATRNPKGAVDSIASGRFPQYVVTVKRTVR